MKAAVAAPAGMMRICVVAERMSGPLDEGGRKFAYLLAASLREHASVLGISVGGAPPQTDGYLQVPGGRTFAAPALRLAVRQFSPDVILYIPEASMTVPALLRARRLRAAFPSARLALVALQPRRLSPLGRTIFRLLRPDTVLALGQRTAHEAANLGCRTAMVPPAVDLEHFRPVDARQKLDLRERFGLPEEAFIVLHVGHAKYERGVDVLAGLDGAAQGVLVAAASEGRDQAVVEELRSSGVAVIDEYVAAVHELYQAADCYVFPVFEPGASIDAPLSVFEAMACNLPVVTAPFGSLPDLLAEGPGFRFAATRGDLRAALSDRAWMANPRTREMADGFSWDNAALAFIRALQEVP